MPETDTNLNFSFLKDLHQPTNQGRKVINLIGRKFDRITPLGFLGLGQGGAKWLCLCDCGTIWVVIAVKMLRGTTHSCGCYKLEQFKKRFRTHGMSGNSKKGARVYRLWSDMHTRCFNPKSKQFKDYGGRGITVCAGWQKFENFFADMGHPPTPKHSPDRTDNDGNYSCGHCEQCAENNWPLNCHWIPRAAQARNKRNNLLLTANGETHCMAEWAEILNMPYYNIQNRLIYGWSVEEALGFKERPSKR